MVTYILIGICVAAFVGEVAGGASARQRLGAASCLRRGPCGGSDVAAGDYWRIVTAGFLHAGFFHCSSTFSLWILGGLLEPRSGSCDSR